LNSRNEQKTQHKRASASNLQEPLSTMEVGRQMEKTKAASVEGLRITAGRPVVLNGRDAIRVGEGRKSPRRD